MNRPSGELPDGDWAVGGAGLALLTWRLLVPWDLSEATVAVPSFYDPAYSSGGGADEHAVQIGLTLLVVTLVALIAVLIGRQGAKWFATAGAGTWAVLFAWRTATSTTNGANMWPVAFVILVGPAAVIVSFLVHAVARRSGKATRQSPTEPRGG